ncbi:MAG: TonB-dependent receptor [Pseudomonadota bacterium]|uniref:TonB-dependent receptor n=1 Tax=Phenylobacterium sp. TaxID=1871053 RepID=UPI0025F8731C|nr:TonB-dependent receptor [Phenylobacterium sp.]MBT9473864.1 TonB-dependent receptor [Phenylobacterium sp.]
MSVKNLLASSSAFALLFIGLEAHAQTAAADAPRTVDEIVVTAQKRTQSLQDVPIVVTAVNAQQLQDAGVRDIKDLTVVTPGLTVTTTGSNTSTTARIRGIGTVGDNVGLESSVGVVIDGVYRPRNGVAFGDLGDLERIEVLKGPQGTLFGKNTSAGVINILTKRPEFQVGANSEVTVGNFSAFGAALSLTGPIVAEKVAGRLFLAGRSRDGFYDVVGGVPTNDQNFYTARGQILVRLNDDAEVNFVADYTDKNERCCGAVQIKNAAGPTAVLNSIVPGAIANPPNPKAFTAYGTHDDLKHVVDKGVSATLDWTTPWLGGARFTSITALRDWKSQGGGDTDGTLVDVLYGPAVDSSNPGSVQFRQFSQEFRLAGDTERLNWLVGAFFTNEKLTQHVRLVYGTQFENYANGLFGGALPLFTGRPANGSTFVAGHGQNDTYKQEEKGAAIFTNNSFKITDKLTLTGGARYTWEKKDLDTVWNNTDGGIGCLTALSRVPTLGAPGALICGTFQNPAFSQLGSNSQRLREEKATGTVKLDYRFTPQILAYASYARGYKAGGFNLDRIAQPTQSGGKPAAPILNTSFKPEIVDSYEIGMKNTLFDRTVLLNGTIFYQEFTDFQLNSFNGLVFNVTSVPTVISKGVDADFMWFTPIKGLTVNTGVTYAETYYPKSTASVLGSPPPPPANPTGNQRLPGSRLSLAPLWSASLAATYEHEITDNLVGRVAVNAKYQSSYNTGSNLDPVKTQPGFTLVNARIGIGPDDRSWQVEAWAQNIFDEYYTQVGFDAVAQSGSYDAFLGMPRTYGMTLRLAY